MKDNFFYDPRVEFLSRLLSEDKLTVVTRLQHLKSYVEAHNLKDDLGPEAINFGALYVGEKDFAACLCKSYLASKNEEKCTYELNFGDPVLIVSKVTSAALEKIKKVSQVSAGAILEAGEPAPKAPSKYEMVIALWNDVVSPQIKKGKISSINPERKKFMDKMFKEFDNDHEKVEKMMRHLPNVEWIKAGKVSFYFETIFRNNNFLKFYEEALVYKSPTDEAEDILSELPSVQPVLTDEELAGRT